MELSIHFPADRSDALECNGWHILENSLYAPEQRSDLLVYGYHADLDYQCNLPFFQCSAQATIWDLQNI